MNQEDGYKVARALLLVGGLVALVIGAVELANINMVRLFTTASTATTIDLFGPTMLIVVGVIALVTSSRVSDEPLDIVLAVLGILAGGAGGAIVAIAGILAIVSKHALGQK